MDLLRVRSQKTEGLLFCLYILSSTFVYWGGTYNPIKFWHKAEKCRKKNVGRLTAGAWRKADPALQMKRILVLFEFRGSRK